MENTNLSASGRLHVHQKYMGILKYIHAQQNPQVDLHIFWAKFLYLVAQETLFILRQRVGIMSGGQTCLAAKKTHSNDENKGHQMNNNGNEILPLTKILGVGIHQQTSNIVFGSYGNIWEKR